MSYYNRYKSFVGNDGSLKIVPFISIPEKSTDIYTYWKLGTSRMDLLSYQYYGDANYGWLILQANPSLPSVEYEISDGERIRIPYPLESTIIQYENDIKVYKQINSDE